MDGDDIIERIREKARTASPGYGRYAALQEARRLLLNSGVITVEDDLEDLVSNSGPHQGLRVVPPAAPAAPAMEAGQRTAAYILARIQEYQVRANTRIRGGALPDAVLKELVEALATLRRAQRRRISPAAWEAARKTIAAERRRPAGWVSGPT